MLIQYSKAKNTPKSVTDSKLLYNFKKAHDNLFL